MAEPKTNHRIDYIELSVTDLARTKAFYGKAFGWEFKDYGAEYATFEDGHLGGGFSVGQAPRPGGPLVILYSHDLAATQTKIEQAGGNIIKPTFSFPGGRRFHFTDPDGYELAVWSDR